VIRVLRGRAGDAETDREVTRALVADVREGGAGADPAVRAWTPHRQVAFGRRDARAEGYDRARAAARDNGFPPFARDVGGRAVAYTGTTVAFLRVEPAADVRTGIDDRYDAAVADVRRALADLGVDADCGEPEDAWCPGAHSLSVDGRKLVGIAQRVGRGAASVAGIVLVRDRDAIAAVLADVYDALGVPLDPDTVGSLQQAGGPADPQRVARTVEDALVGDRERTIEHVE
jgi:lipoate-protein ligase A